MLEIRGEDGSNFFGLVWVRVEIQFQFQFQYQFLLRLRVRLRLLGHLIMLEARGERCEEVSQTPLCQRSCGEEQRENHATRESRTVRQNNCDEFGQADC